MADVKNVTAAKPEVSGAIRRAPIGTALPTSVDAQLNAAFANLGYLSEDGYTNDNSPTTNPIKAWGGDIVMNDQTEKPDEFKWTLLEALNENVLKAIYGDDNVSGTVDIGMTVHANSKAQKSCVWVIDETFKCEEPGYIIKSRTVIAEGALTALDTITHKDGDPIGYGMTVSAFPSNAINGDTHVTYTKKVAIS